MCEDKIKEVAYNLPVNNIIKITHALNSLDRKDVLKYKIKLVKQLLKEIE